MSVGRQHPLWNLWHLLTLWCLELVMIFVFWSTAVIKASDAVANLRPRSSSCVSKMGAVWAVSNCDTIAVIHKPPRSSKSSPDPRLSQLFISQKCVRTYWDHHPKAALTVLENERKWDHQHPSIISQCQLVSRVNSLGGPGAARHRATHGVCLLGLFGDGSKPWYLVNPKIAGKWMFIPLKMYL